MLRSLSPTWVKYIVFSISNMSQICCLISLQHESDMLYSLTPPWILYAIVFISNMSYVLSTCLQHESCVFFVSNTVHICYPPCVSNMGHICCLYLQHESYSCLFFLHESHMLFSLSPTWVVQIGFSFFNMSNIRCLFYLWQCHMRCILCLQYESYMLFLLLILVNNYLRYCLD